MNQAPLPLQITNLSIGYRLNKKRIEIARDISFSLEKGELAAVIGSNGIGKSTLLRTLARVQPSLGGRIAILGKPLEGLRNIELANLLSVVFTDPVASSNLRVVELISLGRQPYTNWIGRLGAEDQERIENALSLTGLNEIRDKKCYEISDGQLQKVLVARALAQDTELMVLDEPTTHLDLHHRVQLLKLLRQISHDTGKTVLFSTHEIEMAIQICDKILILKPGNHAFGSPPALIEAGSFDQLFPPDLVRFDSATGTYKVCP